MYKVTFVQYIAPEWGDGEKSYYAIKETELPFLPIAHRNVGIQWSELEGRYVWHIQSIHYNIDKDRFYLTLNSRWVQVWTGVDYNNYDHEKTIEEMEDYVAHLRSLGWRIVQREDEW
jgi:hypothetical protein